VLVVGDGRALQRAKKLSNELGLTQHVEFFGRHPVEAMPHFYEQADFMLVTLLDEPIFRVTVPLKVQTYMAAGKPIICNIRGEAARVINAAECGLSVPPEDSHALAKALIAAADTSDLERLEMQKSARKYFNDNYSKDLIIESIEAVLQGHC
jgi:glycosyltransferase involved in cell wall biosynthesis